MDKIYLLRVSSLTSLIGEYYPKNIPFGEPEYFDSPQYLRLNSICQNPPKQKKFDNLVDELKKELGQDKVRNYSLLHDDNPSYIIRIVTDLEGDNVESFVVNISIIVDYFTFYVSSIIKKNNRNYFKQYFIFESDKHIKMKRHIARKVKVFFPEYQELPTNMVFINVPTISLGQRAIGEATLFDCLFTDHIW